jgi:hypothetical protein
VNVPQCGPLYDVPVGGVQQGAGPLAGHPVQRQPALHRPHRRKASWDTSYPGRPELLPSGGKGHHTKIHNAYFLLD